MKTKLNTLLYLNNLLIKRVRIYSWYYIILVLFFVIIITIIIAVPLFMPNLIEFESENEKHLSYLVNIYFLIIIDFLLLLVRGQSKTKIEQINFIYFPMKDSIKLNYSIIAYLIDIRVLPYIAISIVFFFYFYFNIYHSLFPSIICVVPIIALYFFITLLYVALFSIMNLVKTKTNIFGTVISTIPLLISLLIIFKENVIINKIIIINNVGEALYSLSYNNINHSLIYTSYVISFVIVFYIVLFFAIKQKWL